MNKLRPVAINVLQKLNLNRFAHHLYYRYLHGFNTANPDVLPAIEACMRQAEEAGTTEYGDYCEFGLFKGYAFWYAQNRAAELGIRPMRYFGFDSFAGLPKAEGIDWTQNDAFYEGQYACTKDQVIDNLESAGVDWERTYLIEGFFETSLTNENKERYGIEKTAIALIDCDLYASTVNVLDFLGDSLLDGTILMFDDWNCFDRDDQRGQRRAFREFLRARSGILAEEMFSYGYYGQVFAIRLDA